MLYKKFSHVTLGPREVRYQVPHILNSYFDYTDMSKLKHLQLLHPDSELGEFFLLENCLMDFPT